MDKALLLLETKVHGMTIRAYKSKTCFSLASSPHHAPDSLTMGGREAGEGNGNETVNPSVMCFTIFKWCFCSSLQLLNDKMNRMWIKDAWINHAAHVNTFVWNKFRKEIMETLSILI